MLKRLHLQNFTVFADANFEFGPGLNVLVGTNGTGKSHVLKLGYALEKTRFNRKEQFTSPVAVTSMGNTSAWNLLLYRTLPAVFETTYLETLIRWNTKDQAEVESKFAAGELLSFNLFPPNATEDMASSSLRHVAADVAAERVARPILIPAKEILTLGWMLPASEQIKIPGESNYLDLFKQLRLLPLRNPESIDIMAILAEVVGGEIVAEGDAYFLLDKVGRRITISMIAEGVRKFGTLQKLLANGSLTKEAVLFWDEPESNLNPALLRKLAAILAELARQGFQIILATHSMSLLKEFHILSRETGKGELPIKYFSLSAEPGEATTVVERTDFKYLPNVTALDVELDQADELEEIFAREARQAHADDN